MIRRFHDSDAEWVCTRQRETTSKYLIVPISIVTGFDESHEPIWKLTYRLVRNPNGVRLSVKRWESK